MGLLGPKCLRWVVLVVVFVIGLGGWGESCWEPEKLALLQLKPFFNVQLDPGSRINHYVLYNWVEEGSDCCEWERVECDATSRRVIGLSLTNFWVVDYGYAPWDMGWYLNTSLFLPFKELKSLSLGGNPIAGCLHNEGFEKLALKLKKLEVFDLSLNLFNDSSILSSLVEISSLKSLNLSHNQLGGLPTKSSGIVEISDLKGNELDDNILVSLSELSSLKYLDLSDNHINGSIHITEFKNLLNLKELYLNGNGIKSLDSFHGLINLEVLALTFNDLNNSILSFLGPFSKCLTHLYINNFGDSGGSIDIKDARRLKSLEGVATNNSVPHLLQQSLNLFPSLRTIHFESDSDGYYADETVITQSVLQLRNLESLNIDGIPLQNNFLENIGRMTSLKILSLSKCGLNGTLSTQDICQLRHLEELDLSDNILRGVLPDCFSNLTFLKHLDISSNQFYGNLLAISPLQSLTYIDLSNNQFQIQSSLNPFFNHSKLKHFYGNNNSITYAETELHPLAPQFQLNHISLSCCGDVGPLPKFLYHQHELLSVDLSNINLTGAFPSWLLKNNTKLETLFLTNNSLSGHFGLSFHSPMKLSEFDFSSNFIDGHILEEIGVYLPGLTKLNISNNHLNGSIPSSIGDMKSLATLDLSNNRLFGIIPENLAAGCSSLEDLVLSNNRLQGQIFSANFNLTNLRYLNLAGNHFTGSIPNSLSNCSFLTRIDIGYNHLSGKIPRWMGNSSLSEIFMPNNHIEGPIPMEFCQSRIEVLDLSMNSISKALPSCFGTSSITNIHLSKNRLQGPIPNSICKNVELMILDLSDNQLVGNIPNCISNLTNLSYLVLKHNNLEGEIPNQLCQLDNLNFIDFSHNDLSGHIPDCLNITVYEKETSVAISCPAGLSYESCLSTSRGIPSGISSGFPSGNISIELTTKSISYSYKMRILRYFSGIDLSSNKLTGEIPFELGNLNTIRMLNLSHNSLVGSIPPSLSNLQNIESLDLSYNNLSGSIPPQFVMLHFLAYFNVSYNNLSGKPPPRVAQFASDIDENSYWGNPFLCGEPLPKNCLTTTQNHSAEDREDCGLIDIQAFYVTFIASYIMVLLCIAAIMYINPHWRRAWFYLIEKDITSCFYFVIDNLPTQFRCGNI